MDADPITENTIVWGTSQCGHVGQIFRTGKCANCYIADLEHTVSLVKAATGCDSVTEAMAKYMALEGAQKRNAHCG